MTAISADWVLLPHGWSPAATIEIMDGGIVAIRPGRAAEHIAGALLPGLVNLHSHAFQRSFAGRTEFAGGGGDFWSWRTAMYRAAAAIEPDSMVAIAAYVGMLALQGGFTSLVEFHYLQNRPRGSLYAPRTAMADAIIEGARQAGIGLTMLYGIYETANFGGVPLLPEQRRFRTSPDEALSMMETSLPRQADDLRFGLAPHSLRAVPPDSLAAAAEGLARLDPAAPLHIHAAEQRAEVQACVARLGTTPIDWLLHNAPLGPTWCLIHATHASEAELSGLARSGAVAGLCPSTEANLGDGLFGLPAYVQANGRLGIGTDSHVGLDAFAELRLLEYGQRLRAERRNMLAGTDGHSGRVLWQAASSGGAQAAGRAVGAISPGCRADLVAITPSPETADAGPDFWLDAAIFSSHTQAARDVMVGGAWVVRGGTHVRGDLIAGEYRKKGLLF